MRTTTVDGVVWSTVGVTKRTTGALDEARAAEAEAAAAASTVGTSSFFTRFLPFGSKYIYHVFRTNVKSMTEPLTAIGDPALREVLLHVRAQPGSRSADDVAAALGLHRNVARSRLERL